MTETVLDRLAAALEDAARRRNPNVYAPPVAVLWPDKARQFENSIETLRGRRRIVTLGPYDPVAGSGPAYWLRCVTAGTIAFDGPEGPTVIYLPGVRRDDLRSVAANDQR